MQTFGEHLQQPLQAKLSEYFVEHRSYNTLTLDIAHPYCHPIDPGISRYAFVQGSLTDDGKSGRGWRRYLVTLSKSQPKHNTSLEQDIVFPGLPCMNASLRYPFLGIGSQYQCRCSPAAGLARRPAEPHGLVCFSMSISLMSLSTELRTYGVADTMFEAIQV